MTALPPKRPSVLIVDDSPGVLLAMEKLLSPYVPVQVADGGAAALRALTPETALVLTDIRMPDMDGLELARTLREQRPEVPVVFMTGIVEDGLRTEAKALGVLDVLRKPLKPGVLLPALQEWMAEGLPNWDTVPDMPEHAIPEHDLSEHDLSEHSAPTAPHPASTAPTAASASPVPAASHGLRPLTEYFTGLSYLPGVMFLAAFDPQGALQRSHPALPDTVGAYVRFLVGSASTLGTHLRTEASLKAMQVEFADRVLVVVPAPNGFLVVVVRDTSAASGVKSWLRTHLHEQNVPHLN